MITQQEFEKLAGSYAVVPLVETMLADLHTPVSIYLSLHSNLSPSFLLESVEPDEKIGRYSFVGTDPLLLIKAKGDIIEIENGKNKEQRKGKVIDVLEEYSQRYRNVAVEEQQGFSGGFLGYYGYDRIQEIESVPVHPCAENDPPDSIFGLFHTVVKFDHLHQLMTVTYNCIIDKQTSAAEQYHEGKRKLESVFIQLGKSPSTENTFHCDSTAVKQDTDRDLFCSSVRRAKEYIHEGDIFQVVLSRRIQLPFSGDP
ncbi:MAG: chorismate-binding protein, partial [Bacteroidetes bacterium]|nr:chorismate-binding protein [Bacteroidota bacterium]